MNFKLKLKNILKGYSSAKLGCIIFSALMFTIFPIIFLSNFYFSLNQAKLCFLISAEIVLVIFVIIGALYDKSKTNLLVKRKIIMTDYLIYGLCAVSIISGLFSEFFPYTLAGVTGRYNGIIIMILYVLMYFILNKFLKNFSETIFILFAVSSFFVYLLGALNCFSIDVFSAFVNIKDSQKAMFISTIGNRNFFSSFICLSLPIFTIIFCKAKSKVAFLFYIVVTIFGFFALFCANSDSGFIGIFAMFAFISLFVIKNIKGFRRYLLCLLLLFLSGIIFGYIVNISSSSDLVHSPIVNYLINNGISYIILISIMFIMLLTFIGKSERFIENNIKKIKYIVFMIYIAFSAVILFLFVWYSIIDKTSNLNDIGKYFRFSDDWGSFRGSVWSHLISLVPMLSAFQIFFGTGPDTIYQILSKYYSNQIKSGEFLKFDSAHNEYLHYFITTGVIGALLYILLIVMVIYYGIKMTKKYVSSLACTSSIFCYAIQGFFNISMISTTPLFFLMIAIITAQYSNNYYEINYFD